MSENLNEVVEAFFAGKIPTFGVAGNFTGHLEQAGEASDFANMKTAETNAPKAIFPTFIPNVNSNLNSNFAPVPDFLHTFPFTKESIIFPKGEQKLQIEPECALIFNAIWNGTELKDLIPVCFGASNDCSIRKEGAKKISQKKNWCNASKGFNPSVVFEGSFNAESNLNSYRIASYLVRNGKAYSYGENSAVSSYSYIYEKLVKWMLEKFNGQKDEGPAEDIHSYLVQAGCPAQIMVSIGATRYTAWGESNFLQAGDDAVVVVYPEKYSEDEITKLVEKGDVAPEGVSVLRQKIVL